MAIPNVWTSLHSSFLKIQDGGSKGDTFFWHAPCIRWTFTLLTSTVFTHKLTNYSLFLGLHKTICRHNFLNFYAPWFIRQHMAFMQNGTSHGMPFLSDRLQNYFEYSSWYHTSIKLLLPPMCRHPQFSTDLLIQLSVTSTPDSVCWWTL